MTRIAFLHTGAVVIPTFAALAAEHLPGVEVQNLLDDKIVADLGRGAAAEQVAQRLADLGDAAVAAGAEAVMFTCSSISQYAGPLADRLGVPVYRVDEAMADEAVRAGDRVSVIATLPTTVQPTATLLRERAEFQGRDVEIDEVVVPGAFEAAVAGDRGRHDSLVAEAIKAASGDVVVLAQASMASAAEGLDLAVPVLTSPERGIRRLAEQLK
ncbi:aspartate/glutamate racemase family protein [Kribbella sp. VKM Ac-2566]|uniref:aspartate/glutamate racemase family protein n=1 Tax=Kribbella sp. VKM Ac-2566 TaxID=2512218 RepID=UPI00106428A4|nr:aspartate/glutamate racemase family protein [Kribbella sp. VKM Ac-2566]TDW98659.1 aspartate/glutamate racemase [Kribbella sp. VKM Ac-2566]